MLALIPAFNVSIIRFQIFYKLTYTVGDYLLVSIIRVIIS
jgi:hypothetical protein